MSEQEEMRGLVISQYLSTLEERTLRVYHSDRERMVSFGSSLSALRLRILTNCSRQDQANMQWSMMQNAMDATGKVGHRWEYQTARLS
jgi:hypothetical protein